MHNIDTNIFFYKYTHYFKKGLWLTNWNRNKHKNHFLLSSILIQFEISKHLKTMLTSPPPRNEKDFFKIKIRQMLDFDLKRCSLADNMESKLPKFIVKTVEWSQLSSKESPAPFPRNNLMPAMNQPTEGRLEPGRRAMPQDRRDVRAEPAQVLAAAVTSCPQHHSILCPDHIPADHRRVLHLSGCLDFSWNLLAIKC